VTLIEFRDAPDISRNYNVRALGWRRNHDSQTLCSPHWARPTFFAADDIDLSLFEFWWWAIVGSEIHVRGGSIIDSVVYWLGRWTFLSFFFSKRRNYIRLILIRLRLIKIRRSLCGYSRGFAGFASFPLLNFHMQDYTNNILIL